MSAKEPSTTTQAVQTSAAPAVFFQNAGLQATTALLAADVQVKTVPDKELSTAVQAVHLFAVPVASFHLPTAQATT